jgi:hypothetical protein
LKQKKQFKYTAVHISRHKLHQFQCELQGEEQATVADGLEGAKPSCGPTRAEVLSHKLSPIETAQLALLRPKLGTRRLVHMSVQLDRSLSSW